MPDDEDWLMRPVLAGICLYESLINKTLSLRDIVRMNTALDVKSENEARAHKAANPPR